MVDVGIGPWGDSPTFHAPVFVLTSRPHPPTIKQGGTSYTFVTDGPEAALREAAAAAGSQEVLVNGGAATARQFLTAGLVDQLRIHLVPILLGAGTSMFAGIDQPILSVHQTDVSVATDVTHLNYDLG